MLHSPGLRFVSWRACAVAGALAAVLGGASGATPAELSSRYTEQAGAPARAERGRQFFNAVHAREWSCASCHGAAPTRGGQHAATGKPIAPLAPAANPSRFTDPTKVEKWFRRNCNDVLARECSAAEKADVIAWLLTLQP